MAEEVEIILNGERRRLPSGKSLLQLIQDLGLEEGQVAAEVNRQVVRRDAWERTPIVSGDEVEIVHFVGGGEEPFAR